MILVVLTIFVTIKEFPDRDVSKVRVEQGRRNHLQDSLYLHHYYNWGLERIKTYYYTVFCLHYQCYTCVATTKLSTSGELGWVNRP